MLPKNQCIVSLGGHDRLLHFGMGFMAMLLEKTSISADEIGEAIQKNPFKTTAEIIQCAMHYAHIRNGKEFSTTLYEIYDWVDNAGGFNCEAIKTVMTTLTASMQQGTEGIVEQSANPKKTGRKIPKKK